jgi:hypothetical protein
MEREGMCDIISAIWSFHDDVSNTHPCNIQVIDQSEVQMKSGMRKREKE